MFYFQQRTFSNQFYEVNIKIGIMCHNPGARHVSSLVKLTSAESCQSSNFKIHLGIPWEQLYHLHLGTILPVLLGNNRANLTWE